MAERNKSKLTPFQKERNETLLKIANYKKATEANVVSILFKHPDLMYEIDLTIDDFNQNAWKVFFQIIYDLVIVEKKTVLDDITIGLYLEKHDKLRQKYVEYGGFKTLESASKYIDIKNFDGYVAELKKWKAVIELCKEGFPVKDNLSEFVDMSAEEIYNKYTISLNHTFANVETSEKSYNIADGIHDLIEELNEESAMGLSYYSMPTLTNETGGQYLGSITLLGGLSNVGKSTLARSLTIPSIMAANSSVVIMINEDSFKKWQREMLVWICNNILHYSIQKHTIRDGNFTKEVKSKLHEAGDWLEEQSKSSHIVVIPFLQYKTSKVVKNIRKYASMGVKYFVLDTFKMDAGNIGQNSWLQMQQSMVDIKDVVKSEALNVHILITFQLEKGSSVMRYYTQNNIGMAKNIIDVASTCIMVRDVMRDEYPKEKNALKVYNIEGKGTKVMYPLDDKKTYQILFIVKNQEGAANTFQIVAEHDKSRNIIKEVGITNILPEF